MPHASMMKQGPHDRIAMFDRAPEAKFPRAYGEKSDTNELLAEIKALRRDVAEMRAERNSPILTGPAVVSEFERLPRIPPNG